MINKTKTYYVKHKLEHFKIVHPKQGYTINLNINMTFQAFTYLFITIGLIGWIVSELVEMICK